jgi:hypothetical protein
MPLFSFLFFFLAFLPLQRSLPQMRSSENGRNGKSAEIWGETTEAQLKSFGYQHLGGKIISSQTSGEAATVILRALIASGDGVTWKRETYTLRYVGRQWLIDRIEVIDEPR